MQLTNDNGAATMQRTAHEIRTWIRERLADSLDLAATTVDTAAPLDSLGVDSLVALNLTGELAGWLGRELPATLLWDYASIDAIAETLGDAEGESTQQVSRARIIDLQPLGEGPPIFFLPGIGGHPVSYRAVTAELEPHQPCYGLVAAALDTDCSGGDTMPEIAAEMLESVRLVQPEGPYRLVGHSFGGLLAYEMAQQLLSMGEQTSLLLVADTFAPGGIVPRPRWQRALIHAWRLGARPWLNLRDYFGRKDKQSRARQDEREEEAGAGKDAQKYGHLLKQAARRHGAAAESYRPAAYPGSLALLRATAREPHEVFCKLDPTNGWGALAKGGIEIFDSPAGHVNLMDGENATVAARVIRKLLGSSDT